MNAPNYSLTPPLGTVHFMRLPEVCARLSVSKSTIYHWLRAGTFPKPRKLGVRTVGWPASDIAAWAASRRAA